MEGETSATPSPEPEPTALGAPLLALLADLPPGTRAAAVIRHSIREPITDLLRGYDAPLTPEGEAAALALGRRLPPGRRLRLVHSPIRRCGVTAVRISAGYQERGGDAVVDGPHPALGGPYALNLAEVSRLSGILKDAFPRVWFDGGISPAVIKPLEDAAREQLDTVVETLLRSDPEELSLLVTHDWNILLLREAFLGLRHEEVGWVDYLDGPVVLLGDGMGGPPEVTLRWRGHRRTVGLWPEFRGPVPGAIAPAPPPSL